MKKERNTTTTNQTVFIPSLEVSCTRFLPRQIDDLPRPSNRVRSDAAWQFRSCSQAWDAPKYDEQTQVMEQPLVPHSDEASL